MATTIEEDRRPSAPQAPSYVIWEITARCDARCLHCYTESGPEVDTGGELSTAKALEVIDQLADSGQMMLAISGGEPLRRADWQQLIGHAVERGLLVTVVTNGSAVDDQAAAALAALRVISVTVSLDSHRPEVHDEIRQLPGLHARALGAIRRLVSHGVRVVVNFTPLRANGLDAGGVVELAYQLGASAVSLSEYVPAGRGTAELGLGQDQLERLVAEWLALKEAYHGRITLVADERTAALFQTGATKACADCGAGQSLVRITPDGSITPCAFVPQALGSVQHEPLGAIWGRSGLVQEARSFTRSGGSCATCGLHRIGSD